MPRTAPLVLVLIVAGAWFPTRAEGRSPEQTIAASHEVLTQFRQLYFAQIPETLLAEARAVAIVPDVIKLGFVVGGQRGHGVIVIRQADGSWRAPLFITITGGSLGWQIGAQATDFMLVFKTQKSVDGLLRGTFTLGADAAVAAGPVGRRLGAATDAELKAEIYSYSRSRGLFAGISLEGSALQVDDVANATYYPAPLPGAAPPGVPPAAQKLVEIIAGLTAAPVPAAGVAPAGVAPAGLQMPAQPGEPATGAALPAGRMESVRAELARSSLTLQPLLDATWRQYLALPAEVYQPGARIELAALERSLERFRAAVQNPQYGSLTSRPEFQATHRQLQALAAECRGGGGPLALPPPPAGAR